MGAFLSFMYCRDSRKIEIVDDENAVIDKLCATIEKLAGEAISKNGQFTVGVSGGSLVGFLAKGLPRIKTDWSKWVVAFCDERIVPEDDPESTYGAYLKALCDNGLLSSSQFIAIDRAQDAHSAAVKYAAKLAEIFPSSLPRFDLLLLGMGPDGHTCSLFPGHPALDEKHLWVLPVENSPKPPPNRVTLTLPVLNNALNVIFALTGQGKADMVQRILKKNEALPAGRVAPSSGTALWLLDKAAASQL